MFVNRGMIEAAHTEGEVAGVMAHELSHVVLRHGTAQASKATKYEVGPGRGRGARRNHRRRLGSGDSQGTQFGLGAAFLRFSREYEKQADLEGVADHGARRLRSARHGEHVPDDREAGRTRRPAVAERSPEPGQSRRVHHARGAGAARRQPDARHARRSSRCRRTSGSCRRRRRPRRRRKPPRRDPPARQAASRGSRRAASNRRHRASRPTTRAICSASACRRTGGSSRPATAP